MVSQSASGEYITGRLLECLYVASEEAGAGLRAPLDLSLSALMSGLLRLSSGPLSGYSGSQGGLGPCSQGADVE